MLLVIMLLLRSLLLFLLLPLLHVMRHGLLLRFC
jgi:hypothetical protein